jgi:hypothetical protein
MPTYGTPVYEIRYYRGDGATKCVVCRDCAAKRFPQGDLRVITSVEVMHNCNTCGAEFRMGCG